MADEATHVESQPQPQTPQTIGPYRIGETIATGGMGVVYRAHHLETGQVVALKTVARLRPGTLGSIRREIGALLRVQHPGVVRLVGEGLHEGVPWHAMELLEGRTLRAHLESVWLEQRRANQVVTTRVNAAEAWHRTKPQPKPSNAPRGAIIDENRPPAGGGPAPLAASLSIVRRLCQTLAFLHGEGIVHGDLKPDNVVLQEAHKPVLVDFGIMRRFAGATGREAMEVERGSGTLAYMAPEQILEADIDARADLYAVGCLLYEVLVGRPPFVDDWMGSIYEQQLERVPAEPSVMVEGVDPRLQALVMRLLAKDPRERPGYADDVGQELEAIGALPCADFVVPQARAYLYRPNFAGRDPLLSQLWTELSGAREGRGRCVVLSGPSGAGKTRLCQELARHAVADGMQVLSGECAPMGVGDHGAGLPLQAFRPLLLAVADRCRLDGRSTTQTLLGESGRLLEEIEPALAQVPGQEDTPSPPRAEPERLQQELIGVLERFSQLQPLLVVIDDLQWADDLTLGTMRALVNRPERPLHALVLVTRRSEAADATLDVLRGATMLRLDPLGADEVARIVAGMTARDDPPAELVQHLTAETGGNPFFVAEYLKAAVSEGMLVRERGSWQFHVSGAPELMAPGSVQALVARRLDGLGGAARLLVEVGAVLGRAWDIEELAEVAQLDSGAVDIGLDELIARQIVIEEADGRGRFVHDKIRETAYDAIPAVERPGWHARAAEVIARAADDPLKWRRLAYHYQLAGDDPRAFEWSERAGTWAHSSGAFREARQLLGVACSLEGKLPPRRPVEKARLHRMFAEALDNMGEIDAGGHELMEALAALGRPLPRSETGWSLLLLGQLARQLWLRWVPGSHLATEERRAALEEAAISAARLVAYYYFRNQLRELLASVTLATNLAEAAGADGPHARAGCFLAAMLGTIGMHDVAGRYFSRTREAGQRSNDLSAELFQAQVEGMYHLHRADWAATKKLVEPLLDKGIAAGNAFGTEALLLPAALTSLFTGDHATAEARAQKLWQSARARGHRMHDIFGRVLLAECALRGGRPEETLTLVEPVISELEKDGDVVNRLNCMGLVAGARLKLDNLDGALQMAELIRQQIAAKPAAELAPFHLHEHVPNVYLTALERAPSDELLQKAERACRAVRRYARIAAIAQPFALRHRARFAALTGNAGRARRLMQESLALARRHSMPFDERAALAALEPRKQLTEGSS